MNGDTEVASASAGAAGSCVFDAIVRGDTAAHLVFDDEVAVGFLDSRPLFVGHTLVVPRSHVETLTDLPPELLGPFFARVQRMAAVVGRVLDAPGTFVAMNNRVSQSVPHLHVHVVPRRPKDGLRGFFWPRTSYDGAAHAADVAGLLADGWQAAQLGDPLPGFPCSDG